MLNKNQKHFRKQMEQIEREQSDQQDVYSYVQDRFVGNYDSDEAVEKSAFSTFLRIVMFFLIGGVSLFGLFGVIVGDNKLFGCFVTLLLITILLLLFGLISPVVVLMGYRRTRGKVLAVYGSSLFLLVILLGITAPKGTTSASIKPKVTPVAAQEQQPETMEEYKRSAAQIPYIDLARNTDQYRTMRVVYRGKVLQTMESNHDVALRVNVTQDQTGGWNDTLFVNYHRADGESRVLENDTITLWGTVKGLKTYQSVLGESITIPEVDAKYMTIEGQ